MIKNSPLSLIVALPALVATTHSLAGSLTATVIADQQPLLEAVISARPLGFNVAMPPARQLLVDQVDKEFVNQTSVIRVGDSINFPNKDNIDHHVYSFSAAKTFELPLYRDMPEQPVLFDQPGVVKLGCNIHDWMVGYIYVSDTPHVALTGSDGQAVLNDLPAGEYEVRVWHARLDQPELATTQRIHIGKDQMATAAWRVSLKPVFRPRRAPMGIGGGY